MAGVAVRGVVARTADRFRRDRTYYSLLSRFDSSHRGTASTAVMPYRWGAKPIGRWIVESWTIGSTRNEHPRPWSSSTRDPCPCRCWCAFTRTRARTPSEPVTLSRRPSPPPLSLSPSLSLTLFPSLSLSFSICYPPFVECHPCNGGLRRKETAWQLAATRSSASRSRKRIFRCFDLLPFFMIILAAINY